MKPRQRLPQKQSARLYARGNDHRDIIYYDGEDYIYHNALYWTENDQAEIKKENIAWIKYAKNALLNYDNSSKFLGWMDADRQFSYGISKGGGWSGKLFKLECGLAVYYEASGNNRECYVSEDGVVWHDVTSQITRAMTNLQSFGYIGDDTIISLGTSGSSYTITSTTFSKDEETKEFTVEQIYSVFDCPSSWISNTTTIRYVGTYDGKAILVKEYIDNSLNCSHWFFSVNKNGHVEMLSAEVPQTTWMSYFGNNERMAITHQGDRLFFATCSRFSHSQYTHWTSELVAWMSMDGGATWHKETLFSGNDLPDTVSYNNAYRLEMFNRDGEIFILFGQYPNKDGEGARSVHLFSTYTGTQWDEIELPQWVDLPVLNVDSGQGVLPLQADTIRIAIRPNVEVIADYDLFDLLSDARQYANQYMDYEHFNLLFQDGEMADLLDTDFYMVIGTGNVHLYFDNRYMAASSKAFAWIGKAYDDQIDGADHVIANDYCVRGE